MLVVPGATVVVQASLQWPSDAVYDLRGTAQAPIACVLCC